LASIGGTEPAVHDALRKLLSRKITGVRRVALEALLESTPESPDMLGDLLKWLSEGNEEGRLNGILAVGLLEGDRRAAVPILMRTVSDPDPMIRKAAAWALGTIGPEAGAALPTLHQMSADWKNSFVTPRPRNRSQPAYHSSVWSELSPRQNESFRRRSGEARNRLEPLSVQQVVREAIAAIDGAVSPE
jgi:hypothetical protein